MNENLMEFWHATWATWKSGALSTISPKFARDASCEFADFAETSADATNPLIEEFFLAYPPHPSEILIVFGCSGVQPTVVLTSQRLWMFDKPAQNYVSIDLADIAAFQSRSGWSLYSARIRLKDKTERTYEKMAGVPSDEAIGLAIERCNSPEGWSSTLAPVVTEGPKADTTKSFVSYALKEMIIGFAIIGVLVVVGISIFSFFKGGGKEPPKGALPIAMPLSQSVGKDGIPIYGNDIIVELPFAKKSDNFVFAEIVTDAVYQDAMKNDLWVRLRKGYHYPDITLPVENAAKDLSLGRSFTLPIEKLRASGNAKYWLRFGVVEFLKNTKTYHDGQAEASGRQIDELGGLLFLPFRDEGNLTVYPRGEWTRFAPFYVEGK